MNKFHTVEYFKSIEFSFICIAPNHNKCNLKALQRYTQIQDKYNPVICNTIIIQSQFIIFQISYIHTI